MSPAMRMKSAADDCCEFRKAADGMKALLLESVPFRLIADRGKGFAKLPVRGVKKNETHGDFCRTRGVW